MPYRAPVAEIRFVLDRIVGFDQVAGTERFTDATPDTVEAILLEAGKLVETEIAPLNKGSDQHHSRLENGKVRAAPGFDRAYAAIRDALHGLDGGE